MVGWPELARGPIEIMRIGGGGVVSSPRDLTPRVVRVVGKHMLRADRSKV